MKYLMKLIRIPIIRRCEHPYEKIKIDDNQMCIRDRGIPYLHITKMIYPRASDTYAQYAETFLARAAQFSQKPLAILDLRGNPGGNAMLSYAWSHSYAKQRLSGYGARMLRLPLHEQKFKQLMDEKTDQSLASLLEDLSLIHI